MNILNILIYDYTQKARFDYTLAIVLLILLALGIVMIKLAKTPDINRMKPGLFSIIRIYMLKANPKKNLLYGRIAIGFGIFMILIYTYNFLLIKKPGLFNEVANVNGTIEKLQEKTSNGTTNTLITINHDIYVMGSDKGYIAAKKLNPGDSIKLQYMIDSNPRLNNWEKKRVVRLEIEN